MASPVVAGVDKLVAGHPDEPCILPVQPGEALSLAIGGLAIGMRAERPGSWVFDQAYRAFLQRGSARHEFRVTRETAALPCAVPARCYAPGYWALGECGGDLVFSIFHRNGGRLYQVCTVRPGEGGGVFVDIPEDVADERLAPFGYPMDYLVYSKLFLREHAYLLHGCALLHDGHCLVFAGAKGAGKSTTARLWSQAGATVLSEEQVVLRIGDGGVRAFGSPWYGESRVCDNRGAKVDAVFFIEHGPENRPLPLRGGVVARELLRKIFLATVFKEEMEAVMADCGRVAALVPVFRYPFVPDLSAVRRVLAELGRP